MLIQSTDPLPHPLRPLLLVLPSIAVAVGVGYRIDFFDIRIRGTERVSPSISPGISVFFMLTLNESSDVLYW